MYQAIEFEPMLQACVVLTYVSFSACSVVSPLWDFLYTKQYINEFHLHDNAD